jgi:hypothetical protein
VTKTIGNNYWIYSLIIILNAKIVVNVRYGLFKMSNVSHLTMLLPNSNSHGCFTILSMHRIFSTKFSIALMNAENFFKCTQATSLEGVLDQSSKNVCMHMCALSWKLHCTHLLEHVWRPLVVFLQFFEYTCKKNLWSSSYSFFHSLLFKNAVRNRNFVRI